MLHGTHESGGAAPLAVARHALQYCGGAARNSANQRANMNLTTRHVYTIGEIAAESTMTSTSTVVTEPPGRGKPCMNCVLKYDSNLVPASYWSKRYDPPRFAHKKQFIRL